MNGPRRRASWIVGGAAVALAAAALVYDPHAEAAEPKRIAGLLVAAVAFALALVRRTPRAPSTWAARAGAGFVALSGLSLAWGLPSGARDLGTFVGALGAGALTAQLGRSLGRELARGAALAVGALAASAAVVTFALGGRGFALHGGQGNPNWLGLLLAVALPLGVDAARAWGGRARTAAATACAIEVLGLVLSHSRVGWAAAFVGCAWVAGDLTRGPWRRRAALAATTAAILLVARAAAAEGDVPADLALRGRAWIWHGAARAASASAPFGVGLGAFGHAYLTAQGAELARATPAEAARRFVNATTAHDEYLQAAVESGPIAALLLAWALLLGARGHARAGWTGGGAALIALAIACVGDSPLRQPAIALLAGVVLGIPTATASSRASPGVRAWAPAALGLVVVAWLLVPATRTFLATRARTHAVDLPPLARLGALARSVRLDPGSGEAALELGLQRAALGDTAGALGDLQRADALVADTGARVAIGSVLLARGDAVGSAAAYRRALAYDPGSFRARAGLAEALLTSGELVAAEREALVARRLMPGDARVRELLDRIREAKTDGPAED